MEFVLKSIGPVGCTVLWEFLHGTSSSKRLYFILADSHWSDPSHLLTIEAYLLPSALE